MAQERMMGDGELLHPGIRYGGLVRGAYSCASEAFRSRVATFGMTVTTPPESFVSVQKAGEYEDRFRFTVATERTVQQARASLGLSAFDAGAGPTVAQVWRVGDAAEDVPSVTERVGSAINQTGAAAAGAARAVGSAGASLVQGAADTAHSLAMLPLTIAILGAVGYGLWYMATKGGQ